MGYLAQAKSRAEAVYRLVIPTKTALVLLIGLTVVLVEITHLVFLTSYPPLFIDEAWNANAAWNWLQTGINFDSMHAGTLDQYGYEWLRWPVIGNAPWLLSFASLGLGLFQLRLVSWVFGLFLLLAIVVAGRLSYGMITGALAALLLSLSPPFLQGSHYARWDIMIAVVAMAAYAMALVALEKNKWPAHLLAGLLVGLSLDIHLNGLLFAPALAALYLAVYQRKVLLKSGTWLAALGGLLGITYYLAINVLPNPEAYFAQFNFSYAFTHKLPLAGFNPLDLLRSARAEIGRYHFFENNLDFALIGASFAYLATRRAKADRLLLIYVGVAFVNFVLFVGNKHDVYAILLYPFFMLMVAETLLSLIREGRGFNKQRIFAATLLGLLLFNSVVHFTRPIFDSRDYDYAAITDQIKSVIPPEARVMGLPNWWLGLAEYDYRSSLNLTYYHFQNGYTLTEGLEAVRPDILIVDANLQGLLVDEGYFPPGPGFEIYRLPRQEFEDFLSRRGEKVLEFTNPWHGKFEIYAVHWD